MKKNNFLFLLLAIFVGSASATYCPKTNEISYQVNNRGVVVWQPPQGWVVLTTDNLIIRGAMHPKISRFYEAIWSAGSGRNSCRYKLQLDSGATPLLVLHSKQLGNPEPLPGPNNYWTNKMPLAFTCPGEPARQTVSIEDCPFGS